MKNYIICIAHGSEGSWEAICLDYDLAVSGETFDQVQGLMSEVIASYVHDAMKEDEPHRSRLLSRRAPFFARLRWLAPIVWASLFHKPPRDNSLPFPVACPA